MMTKYGEDIDQILREERCTFGEHGFVKPFIKHWCSFTLVVIWEDIDEILKSTFSQIMEILNNRMKFRVLIDNVGTYSFV